MTQIENNWRYGQVKSNALNVRREPSRKARRWNNVWPMNRLVLVKPCGVDATTTLVYFLHVLSSHGRTAARLSVFPYFSLRPSAFSAGQFVLQ